MTLDEALLELGVELPCTAEQARRGYLRRLKGCKPERDPVGFRRLRESYELVFGLAEPSGCPAPAELGGAAGRDSAVEAEVADARGYPERREKVGLPLQRLSDAELDELTAGCTRGELAAMARERYSRNQWLAAGCVTSAVPGKKAPARGSG